MLFGCMERQVVNEEIRNKFGFGPALCMVG
jgi:hypothetical protein